MLDGFLYNVQRERSVQAELLFLQRKTVTVLLNVIESFGKGSITDELDVFPIPEFDKHIKKARAIEKKAFEEKAEQALEKYKGIERRLKGE